MITIRKDGFYQVENYAHVPCIGMETDRMEDCIEGIRSRCYKGVFCSPYHHFNLENLDFLRAMPWLEAVLLRDTNITDIEGLYSLEKLKYFRGNSRRPPLDFTRLRALETIDIEPLARDGSLAVLDSLKKLRLQSYRPTTRDFTRLDIPQGVTELELHWMNLRTLDALPELPNLKKLEVIHCKALKDIGSIQKRYPGLEHFVTKACVRLSAQEIEKAKRELSGLEYLSVEEEEAH